MNLIDKLLQIDKKKITEKREKHMNQEECKN